MIAMQRIGKEHITYIFGADQQAVANIVPGEAVTFETLDSVGGRIRTHADALRVSLPPTEANPATGRLCCST